MCGGGGFPPNQLGDEAQKEQEQGREARIHFVKTYEPCGAERCPEPVACPERSRGEGLAAGKLRSGEWPQSLQSDMDKQTLNLTRWGGAK